MATERDFIDAVRRSLMVDGALGRFKAEMRTEVMRLLDGSSKSNGVNKVESPRDVVVMNELVREYLDWMGYKYTSSVLLSECNLSEQPLDRSFLLQDLRLRDNEAMKKIPLLFSLVEMAKSLNSTNDEFVALN